MGRVKLRQGRKGVGDVSLTLRDGAMKTGRGVGAAAATLGDGAAGVIVGDDGVVVSMRGVGGASTGGGDGGWGSMEGARVDAVSMGVEINVATISAILWIS